ncbi:hypothetical protein [Alcanivorax sp.]|jgi:hypothetical protein|uniref:hypothetical protein n=1 Tax=Alcanivorax sp. TaxID=1872427 RepID=UPI0039E65292
MERTGWRQLALAAGWVMIVAGTAAPAYGSDYDYIRGDDVYEEDYQYGVDYDGLTSVPQPGLKKGGTGSAKNAEGRLQKRALELQENTTQPSMTRELDRWKPSSDLTTPGKSSP